MNQRIDRLLVGANLAIHNVLRAISQDGKHRAFEPEVYYLAIPCKMEGSTASPVVEVHPQFRPNDCPADAILKKLRDIALEIDSSDSGELLVQEFRTAISACVGTSKIVFCSSPERIDEYVACVVLLINKLAYDEVPRLVELPHPFAHDVQFSLLDNAIDLFLRDCSFQLKNREVDFTQGWQPTTELLRISGFRMAIRTTFSATRKLAADFFENCTALANAQYERRQAFGTILIAGKEQPDVDLIVSLEREVALGEIRASRKLLQLCQGGLFLLCDGMEIFGLGGIRKCDASKKFTVVFARPGIWEMKYGGVPLMLVQNGTAVLPSPEFPEHELRDHVENVLGHLEPDQLSQICELARSACSQGHGATIVVSANAAKEAERLQQQSFRLAPLQMTEDLISAVTNIDGAILLDAYGRCHAIGVILDGRVGAEAVESANRGRGARYNSAVRYTSDEHTPPCVVIVKSEDGMLDFFVSSKL